MIALSEPWGTVVLLIVTLSAVSAVLWRLHLHAEKLRRDLREVIDRAEKRMARPSDVAIEDARASERRAMLARAAWFDEHEPTQMAVIAAASCDDAHRQHVIGQWREALARHDALSQVEAAKTKRPTRKRPRRKKDGL